MSKFVLSHRSNDRLVGVHPRLVRVVRKAITLTEVDFAVLEGVRDERRQAMLVEVGASWTMNSRHLTGHAVDLGAWVDGRIAWDWPLYFKIAEAMRHASKWCQVTIEWGGDWPPPRSDGPHFQLPWREYPAIMDSDQDAETDLVQPEAA